MLGILILTYMLKGTISNPKFQTSLFSEPPDFFFLHIQGELHYNTYKTILLEIAYFGKERQVFVVGY